MEIRWLRYLSIQSVSQLHIYQKTGQVFAVKSNGLP